MPKQQYILNVFLASPSDVNPEREIIQNIINEVNKTWSNNLNIRLELLRWETDITPGFSNYPQEVINQQIESSYDIFIGLIWGKFGTKTDKYNSGTEEEFYNAYHLHKSGKDIDLLIYFKNDPISIDNIDPEEISKIQIFKKTIQNLGGVYGITTEENFEGKLRTHLSRIVQKWKCNFDKINYIDESTVTNIEDNLESFTNNIVKNVPDEDEEGILDITERGELALQSSNNIVNQIADKLTEFTHLMGNYSSQLTRIKDTDTSTRKFTINQFSQVIIKFSSDLNNLSNDYKVQIDIAIDTFTKLLTIYTDTQDSHDNIENIAESAVIMRTAVADAINGTDIFLKTVKNMPRATTELNRSKKSLIQSLETLINYLFHTQTQFAEIHELSIKINAESKV